MGTDLKEARQWLHQQLPQGAGVLCAVSGGRDSMVLLHLLKSCGYAVTAAHLHHGLRGLDADRDQMFVRDYCRQEGIPFRTAQVDAGAYAALHGLSIEEAARDLRDNFLNSTAIELGLDCIATGHQLEDQAETILLNLTRGTGADGLRGIARRKGRYIRPLLLATREEIGEYAQAYGIPNVEDESNQNLIYSRNRIRHKVLPQLQEINPGFCQSISRTAHILAEESHLLDRLVVGMFPAQETEDGLAVDYEAFRQAEPALRRRVARMLVSRLPVGRKDFSAVHFDAMANMKRGDCLILPRGVFAAVEGQQLLVGLMQIPHHPVPLEGEAEWTGWLFTASEGTAVPDEDTMVLAMEKLTLPLTVGTWHSGDRMADGNGERTMKRLFADKGVPVYRRSSVPVLYSAGKPVGAFGVAVSAAYTPAPGERTYVVTRRKKKKKENKNG